MKGFKRSFVTMFQPPDDELEAVNRVEIPLIQRDYAQGRDSEAVRVIRNDFLDVLVEAITGGTRLDLDFVYGEIEGGTLKPLDGQQRLTTLFLIHWYVAARTARLSEAAPWLKFTYATRPTAELFCRQLVKPNRALTPDLERPSDWITDQPWYLFAWRHDPTVQSMLVMLDAIHARLSDADLESVWLGLADPANPPISFHFLPIDDMPSGDELYIKMNSRGKPLTEFETFKARFERVLEQALPSERFEEIVHKFDGSWTDVLWPYHGGDFIVDDEFLRYLEFIIEVCEWRDGVTGADGTLLDRAEAVFSSSNESAERNLDFLFHAFDTWAGVDIAAVFDSHFVNTTTDADGEQVILFESKNVNLFQECCRLYGVMNVNARRFSLPESLMLFSVLIHRQYETDEIQTRLRILRNLTDRSDEVRENRMIELIDGVERLIRDGTLDDLKGFNPDRVQDEQEKREFLAKHGDQRSTIHALEDHPLLRGRVYPFDLDAETLDTRAATFTAIAPKPYWARLTAALLAKGNYGFEIGDRAYQFGTGNPDQELRWREVFTRYGRGKNDNLRGALAKLLDAVALSGVDPAEALDIEIQKFLEQRRAAKTFDWRYYLVRYESMREGATGIYYGEHLPATGTWGYSMCMLRTQSLTGSAKYRDPYLLAAWRSSGLDDDAMRTLWFTGYESDPRWLRLAASDTGIRCVTKGFELQAPEDEELAGAFDQVCKSHGVSDGILSVAQTDSVGELIDCEDRVKKCAGLLKDLVAAGL